MKKLDIISLPIFDESGNISRERDIYLTEFGEIMTVDDKGRSSFVDHSNSYSRAICFSELYGKLDQRRWHLPVRKIIKTSDTYGYLLCMLKDQSVLYLTVPSFSMRKMDHKKQIYVKPARSYAYVNQTTSNITTETAESIDNKYKDIMDKITSINLYNSAKLEVDLTGGMSITLDLISSDQYSNTISLLEIEKKSTKPNIFALVDLSIKYTILPQIQTSEVVPVEVYKKNLFFEAFRYNEIGESEKINFISTVGENDGKISVEYIDGIIRVVPDSPNIGECIISNCVITYGSI